MMEAVRSLGFGARFVTGYLYDPKLEGMGDDGTIGAGATHAWCEIYLPGAGWVEYDPTNALIGSEALIRVAVTRDPSQASPISGSYVGEARDYLGMSVDVTVQSGDPAGDAPRVAAGGSPRRVQGPGGGRRLDLPPVARDLLSEGPAAGAGTQAREQPADLDRDQRHVL